MTPDVERSPSPLANGCDLTGCERCRGDCQRNKLAVRSFVSIWIRDNIHSTFISFSPFEDGRDHFAIRLGSGVGSGVPLVRIHSECVTGDVFGSTRCDCGPQLNEAIKRIADVGGYILYLRQEGRGVGLAAKLDAYTHQDRGLDTYEANVAIGMEPDGRRYNDAARMLAALCIPKIRLLTNNPDKVNQLRSLGIEVQEMVPTSVFLTDHNYRYLETKRRIGGHDLDVQ